MFNETADPPAWLAPGCDRTLKPMGAVFKFALLGRLLAAVFERSDGTLVLSRHREDGEEGPFSLAFRGERLQATTVREHISEAFETAIDLKREKLCQACKLPRPIEAFARCRSAVDGRLYRCRECEKTRLRKYYNRRKIARFRASEAGKRSLYEPGATGETEGSADE